MQIAIIGGGAVGLLIASYIQPNHQVHIYTRRQEQAEDLQKNGITCHVGDAQHTRKVAASTFGANTVQADIYIVATKQYHLPEIYPVLQKLTGKQIIFVQNGMGHLRHLEAFAIQNIAVGIVEHGAKKRRDTVVEHTGQGRIKIGVVKGEAPQLVEIFPQTQFPTSIESNWKQVVHGKLLVNIAINPLTALYGVTNGELVSNPNFYQAMKTVFEETFPIIGTGEKEAAWQMIVDICNNTSKNKSSMLKDIENKQQTEIDSIVGYVMEKREGKVPLLTFLYHSIKGLESRCS